MFSKSLLATAIFAYSAQALKLKTGLKAGALANVNIEALSQTELTALMQASEEEFSTFCEENQKSYISEQEKQERQKNWLKTKAENDTHNADPEKTSEFGENQFSDMTEEEKSKSFGTHAPADAKAQQLASIKEQEEILAQLNSELESLAEGVKISYDMSTEELQALYNEKYGPKFDGFCKRFNTWFDEQDLKYMDKQKDKQRKKKSSMNDQQFEDWWMRVMQDRTVGLASITRCDADGFNGNDGDDGNGDDGNDNNGGFKLQKCDPNANEFVWNDQVIPPIKNQGQCGSCYAFSAMTVLEGAHAIKHKHSVVPFSEQRVVDCPNKYANTNGCNGGWPYSLHESTARNTIPEEADYPYKGKQQQCKNVQSSRNAKVTKTWYINQNIKAVKEAICSGPITMTVKARGNFMQYRGGTMSASDCPYSAGQLDHAVAGIGWKGDALVVRNSWGTGWGDNGNVMLSMKGNNNLGACGIMEYPSSAFVA